MCSSNLAVSIALLITVSALMLACLLLQVAMITVQALAQCKSSGDAHNRLQSVSRKRVDRRSPWICMVVLNFLAVLRSGFPSLRCLMSAWLRLSRSPSPEKDCRGLCTDTYSFRYWASPSQNYSRAFLLDQSERRRRCRAWTSCCRAA